MAATVHPYRPPPRSLFQLREGQFYAPTQIRTTNQATARTEVVEKFIIYFSTKKILLFLVSSSNSPELIELDVFESFDRRLRVLDRRTVVLVASFALPVLGTCAPVTRRVDIRFGYI